jgi:hypothetical protein
MPVVERLGTRCAYCDRDLFASYEDWLNLSVDHVVPRNAATAGIPVEWIEDLLSHVPCCRACNEFLARYQVTVRAPDEIAGFVALRDSTVTARRIRALGRHRIEHERFDAWQRRRQSGEAGKQARALVGAETPSARHPVGGGIGGDASDPDEARVVVDEEEHTEPPEQHGSTLKKSQAIRPFA